MVTQGTSREGISPFLLTARFTLRLWVEGDDLEIGGVDVSRVVNEELEWNPGSRGRAGVME